jgi:hypothetical protein
VVGCRPLWSIGLFCFCFCFIEQLRLALDSPRGELYWSFSFILQSIIGFFVFKCFRQWIRIRIRDEAIDSRFAEPTTKLPLRSRRRTIPLLGPQALLDLRERNDDNSQLDILVIRRSVRGAARCGD